MKVSIVGAGRKRNGIGQYIGKYFHQKGVQVVSVLGTTEETSRRASSALKGYGIASVPFTHFYEMIEDERPDAVVIASPAPTHHEYLAKCVDLGLNIFCEKPFVWPGIDNAQTIGEDLLKRAQKKRLVVAMNSQWPFAMENYETVCGKVEVRESNSFFIYTEPFSTGREMISESVPHALSMLYFVFGKGEIADLGFRSAGEKEMLITFKYRCGGKDCAVSIKMVSKEEQPRGFQFGFNGRIVTRNLGLPDYDVFLSYGEEKRKITDPLGRSVEDFIRALQGMTEPLIGSCHILNNHVLLKKIYDQCGAIWKS
jgi:predicted dehydrogenase